MAGVGIADGSRPKNDVVICPRSSSVKRLDAIRYWSRYVLILTERLPHCHCLGCISGHQQASPSSSRTYQQELFYTPHPNACDVARHSFEWLGDITFFKGRTSRTTRLVLCPRLTLFCCCRTKHVPTYLHIPGITFPM